MKRSSLLWIAVPLITVGCLDTAEPTGPVPIPAPDDGGEIISGAASLGAPPEDASGSETVAPPVRPTGAIAY